MLEKIKRFSIACIIASFVVGVLFIVYPTDSITVAAYAMGAFLILFGAYDLVLYFKGIGLIYFNRYNLYSALFQLLMGVIVLSNISLTVDMFGIFFAVFVISSSVNTFEESIILKRFNISGWFISLVLSLVVMVAGIMMIFVPFEAANTAITTAGIILICDAISGIIAFIKIRKIKKELLETIKISETY